MRVDYLRRRGAGGGTIDGAAALRNGFDDSVAAATAPTITISPPCDGGESVLVAGVAVAVVAVPAVAAAGVAVVVMAAAFGSDCAPPGFVGTARSIAELRRRIIWLVLISCKLVAVVLALVTVVAEDDDDDADAEDCCGGAQMGGGGAVLVGGTISHVL